jgi:ribosomal protein S6
MRNYQLVLVLNSSLSESQRKKTIETIKKWLTDVRISKEEEIGQKALAYTIKRENAGYYIRLYLESETIPSDLEKNIYNQDGVLRHLLLKTKGNSVKKAEDKKKKAKKN